MSDQQQDPQEPRRRRFMRRTRERIQEFEKSNETFRGIVEHFEGHRETYLTGAGCLVVGLVVGGAVRRPHNLNVAPVINIAQETAKETVMPGVDLWVSDVVKDDLTQFGQSMFGNSRGDMLALLDLNNPKFEGLLEHLTQH